MLFYSNHASHLKRGDRILKYLKQKKKFHSEFNEPLKFLRSRLTTIPKKKVVSTIMV